MKLSDLKIKSLKPKKRSYKAFDGEGLFILVNPSGSKLWRLKYRIDGKEKLLAFGNYPDIGLRYARRLKRKARELLALNSSKFVLVRANYTIKRTRQQTD